jgi:hypothetical protein
MALTQTDLDALDAAIATAELEVQIDGRKVRYRSTDELIKARNHVAQVIASGSTTTRTGAYRFNFTTSRGG